MSILFIILVPLCSFLLLFLFKRFISIGAAAGIGIGTMLILITYLYLLSNGNILDDGINIKNSIMSYTLIEDLTLSFVEDGSVFNVLLRLNPTNFFWLYIVYGFFLIIYIYLYESGKQYSITTIVTFLLLCGLNYSMVQIYRI